MSVGFSGHDVTMKSGMNEADDGVDATSSGGIHDGWGDGEGWEETMRDAKVAGGKLVA